MTGQAQPRDKWIPYYFVAFFVVIAIIDGIMVTTAIRTHTGTVTEHPYEKGLAYNDVVKAAGEQEKLGWRGDISFTATEGAAGGTLTFRLRDKDGTELQPESLKAEFYRPTQGGMDFAATLKQGENKLRFPAPGLWEARIYARHDGREFQQTRRIVVE